MRVLTEDADIRCQHITGKVTNQPSQHLVTIAGRRMLVEPDPEGRSIAHCSNVGATMKPCLVTLKVQTGYSAFVRIDGKRVCLDTVTGLTDGTPPGIVEYTVHDPGQRLIAGSG
jgi:hypothetical protein